MPNSPHSCAKKRCGTWIRIPAPSPVCGSHPAAPRWVRLIKTSRPLRMIWWLFSPPECWRPTPCRRHRAHRADDRALEAWERECEISVIPWQPFRRTFVVQSDLFPEETQRRYAISTGEFAKSMIVTLGSRGLLEQVRPRPELHSLYYSQKSAKAQDSLSQSGSGAVAHGNRESSR